MSDHDATVAAESLHAVRVKLDRQILDVGNHSSGTSDFDRARGWHGRRGDSEFYLQPPRGSIAISQFIVGRGAFCRPGRHAPWFGHHNQRC